MNQDPAVLARVRHILDTTARGMSQAEMARRLDIDPSNFSKYLTGRLPVPRNLIERLVADTGVSRRWIVLGEGLPFDKPDTPLVVAPTEAVAPMAAERRGVPVYDIDVTAGNSPLERLLTVDRVSGYIDLPRINPETVVVHVTGDSMEPRIIDGGYIAIRPIRNLRTIFWGQIYVVVMEEYRMVKFLRRHPSDPDMVVLHSCNPAYDDIDVQRSDIQALFLVESILNFKNVC